MAIRVGIDLVSVEEVAEAIAEHGERYLKRVYTEAELTDCAGEDGPNAERLAARFAAKEAAKKALRPAGEAIWWGDLEVVRDPAGWVELKLTGAALDAARAQGLEEFAVSISHERGFATAVVVAQRA